ncbi:hypothetical protein, partial [Inquilinus limosus]|uniref:hypothetical protein n=1 Tax=Inquilinus limosus TaxID=171674 RepID=UPI001930C52C
NSFIVNRSFKYNLEGNMVDSPDILVEFEGNLQIVIECKSTKLTFGAQFSENPIESARSIYSDIAKGVFQIWRYFSHIRRGIAISPPISSSTRGMVLTLDAWLATSRELQGEVLAIAAGIADRDGGIIPEDRRGIVFCSIQDLEGTLAASNEEGFIRTVTEATDERYSGWLLPNIYRGIHGKDGRERKLFPFLLDDVLPWWKDTKKLREERQGRVEK